MIQNKLTTLTAALKDRSGISSLEYAILAAGVLGAVIAALAKLTPAIQDMFTTVISQLG